MAVIRRENKEVICGVYNIRNIVNNKRYIGSSKDIYGRWTVHLRNLENKKHPNDHLQKAWNKYGKENFEFAILEECDENIRYKIEQEWCDLFEAYNPDKGYNIAKVVTCGTNRFTMDDIKNGKSKISYDQFNKILDLLINTNMPMTQIADEVGVSKILVHNIYYHSSYKGITEGLVFKKRDIPQSAKLTQNEVGEIINKLKNNYSVLEIAEEYKVEPHAIYDIRNHKSWKEYTRDIEFPQIEGTIKHKPLKNGVKQFDLSGNLIGKYRTLVEAEQATNICFVGIANVCRGTGMTAGGFVWRYGDDDFNKYPIEKTKPKTSIPVDQYKNGQYIQTFASISEAAKVTGAKQIGRVLKNNKGTSGGFEWKKHNKE